MVLRTFEYPQWWKADIQLQNLPACRKLTLWLRRRFPPVPHLYYTLIGRGGGAMQFNHVIRSEADLRAVMGGPVAPPVVEKTLSSASSRSGEAAGAMRRSKGSSATDVTARGVDDTLFSACSCAAQPASKIHTNRIGFIWSLHVKRPGRSTPWGQRRMPETPSPAYSQGADLP